MSNEIDDDPMATTFCKILSRKIILRYIFPHRYNYYLKQVLLTVSNCKIYFEQ